MPGATSAAAAAAAAALLCLLSVKAAEIFEIKDIAPGHKIVAQIGGGLVINCRTTGCKSPVFSWRTQLDNPLGGTIRYQGNNSLLTLAPLGFQHEHNYLCNAICGNERREKRVQIEIYSFPSDPVIEISAPLVLGKPSNVICRVPEVYPSERLEVSLKKEKEVLQVKEFFHEVSTKSVETKTVNITFTPTEEDIGKEITCIAQLPIEEMELEPRQARHLLNVNFGPRNTHITTSPDNTILEGEALMLSCATESHPPAKVVWKKQLANGTIQHIAQSYNLSISNAQLRDSGIYICEATNDVTSEMENRTVSLSVQAFSPTTPTISDGPEIITEVEDFTVKTTTYNTPQQEADPLGNKTSPAPKSTPFTSYTASKNNTVMYVVDDFSDGSNGTDEIEIIIAKMEEPDYVIPVIVVVSILATAAGPMAAILIYIFRKAKINGSYSLVNSPKPQV